MLRLGFLIGLGFALSACASSTGVPKTFTYDTALRGQQGWTGAGARRRAAEALLARGVVVDPQPALVADLAAVGETGASVRVRRWGLRYFGRDWTRYRAVLAADVVHGNATTTCRLSDPRDVAEAPLLRELIADDGAPLQARLDRLVAACVAEVLSRDRP